MLPPAGVCVCVDRTFRSGEGNSVDQMDRYEMRMAHVERVENAKNGLLAACGC